MLIVKQKENKNGEEDIIRITVITAKVGRARAKKMNSHLHKNDIEKRVGQSPTLLILR